MQNRIHKTRPRNGLLEINYDTGKCEVPLPLSTNTYVIIRDNVHYACYNLNFKIIDTE